MKKRIELSPEIQMYPSAAYEYAAMRGKSKPSKKVRKAIKDFIRERTRAI